MTISVTNTPTAPGTNTDVADRIVNGNPGKSIIHKVGSAKQYANKFLGRVCNQAKFPTKGAARKKG